MTNDLSQIVFGEQGAKGVVLATMCALPLLLLIANLYSILHGRSRRKTRGSAAPFPTILRIGSTSVIVALLLYTCWDVSSVVGLAQGFADPGFKKALVECAVNNNVFRFVEGLIPALIGYVGARWLSNNQRLPQQSASPNHRSPSAPVVGGR